MATQLSPRWMFPVISFYVRRLLITNVRRMEINLHMVNCQIGDRYKGN